MNIITPIQQRLSSKQNFPLRLFAAAFVVSLISTIFSGWQSWQMHKRFDEISMKHVDLAKDIGRIMLLDDVLTMSARMVAASGDFSYEKKYDEFDPQLTSLINDVRTDLAQSEIEPFAIETDEANLALVKIERRAFALAHQGKRQEAALQLTSAEYMRLKEVYADGMKKAANAVEALIAEETRHLHSRFLWLELENAVGVFVLLAVWLFADRSARRWGAERMEAKEALQKNHNELEVRIEQRTASLLGVNEQLKHEIAERKRTEVLLRKLSLAVEQSSSTIVITDLDAKIEYVNEAFFKVTGYSLDEAIGQNPRILSSGKTPKTTYDDMWAHLTRGEVWKGELINRRKDGSEYIESVRISPVRQQDGSVTHYVAIKEDITQFKQAQEALRVSRESLHRLLNSMGEGAYGVDLNGNCTFVNQAFLEMLGYQNESEVLGKHTHELIHHSHADGSSYPAKECKAYCAYLTNRSSHVSDEVYWRKDGVAIPVEYWSYPILIDGAVTGAIITFVDIAERKRMEETLKNMAAKFHTVFELSSDAIMLLDEKGFFDCNEATLRLFGCPTRADFISQHPAELSPPTQPDGKDSMSLANEHMATAIKNGSNRFEWIHRRLDGTEFLAEVLLTALELHGKQVLQATVRDITERKHAEEALRKSEERYRQIVETAQEGIWIIDANNITIFANKRIATLLGYTVEEMLGMSLFDFMDEAGKAISALNVERRRQGITEQHDFKLQRKDETDLWVIMETSPMVNEGGEYMGALAMITDITGRVLAQSQLMEQLDELSRWHAITSGREGRILDLKHEVNQLLEQIGQPPRYSSAESSDLMQDPTKE